MAEVKGKEVSSSPHSLSLHWEVLNGVGVDGVGGIFPFFCFVFFRFSSHFFDFLCFSPVLLRARANDCNLLGK